MLNRRALALFVTGVGFITTLATTPVPASAQLTPGNVEAVILCQESIKEESRKFVAIKMKAFEQCVDLLVEAELRFEAGALDEAQAEAAAIAAARRCALNFRQITNASTVLVNKIVQACQPVEDLVLGDTDALGFLSGGFFGGFTGSNVTELAGFLCAVNEFVVDTEVLATVPLLQQFGFGGGVVPLDPRCATLDD